MKLLSHNHLLCLNKDCKCNEALIIEPKKVIQIESDPKLSFMIHILSMIDYNVLLIAASQIGIKDLPKQLPSKEIMESSESFLRSMQKVLLDSNVIEGKLICNKCKTSYLIKNGVVDMMHPLTSSAEESKDDDDDNNNNNDEDVDMDAFINNDKDVNDDDDAKTNNNDPQNENEDDTNQDMIDID